MISFFKSTHKIKIFSLISLILSPSFLFLFISPLHTDKVVFGSLVDRIYSEYESPDVQKKSGTILIGSLSRREAASIKTLFLEKLSLQNKRKKIIIFSNHQLQYITSGFERDDIFNMWNGNFSINEIADFILYLDAKKPFTLPTKYLVTSITSPNNDNGNFMVGYSGNLPAYIPTKTGKRCTPPFIEEKTLKQSFESCFPIENFIYYLDFKSIVTKFIRKMKNTYSVKTVFIPSLNQPFSIDKTGSSLGAPNVGNRSLIFNEEGNDNGFDTLLLRKNDASRIIRAVLQIDKVAYKNGLKHIFIIPPVYESSTSQRSNSRQNLIMDEVLMQIKKYSKATQIIDDRRNPEFLEASASQYYYHYDHPSSKYGSNLIERILKK